jgi:arylsulfatase A-like enzyme
MNEGQKPNIFFFVMDTARAANISAYGYEEDTTPFLGELADQGMKFENCMANAPWTLPSHVSMFTGKYPHEHEKMSMYDEGSIYWDTLPEDLSDKGYETFGFSNNGWISSLYGFERLFDDFEFITGESKSLFEDELFQDIVEKEREDYWDSKLSKYTDFLKWSLKDLNYKALANGVHYVLKHKLLDVDDKWSDSGALSVEKRVKNLSFDGGEPKFVFANFVEPHSPYLPPRKFAEMFSKDIDEDLDVLREHPYHNLGETDRELADKLVDYYDAEIRYLDSKIEDIFEWVESNSDRDNVFVIVGDHGEMFDNDTLWEHHGGLRRELLHVPLIVYGWEDKDIEELFELREMKDLVNSIAEGQKYKSEDSFGYAEYLGVDSHLTEKFDQKFEQIKVSKMDSGGFQIFSKSSDVNDSEVSDRLRELKILKNRMKRNS